VDPDPDWEFGSRHNAKTVPKKGKKLEKFMLEKLSGGLDASSVS
jgi:hypothetical protein